MARVLKRVNNLFKNYRLVIENYFFMTMLQFINSFAYLAIYPFLIKNIGVLEYGGYVFKLAIVMFFSNLVNYGLDLPGLKEVSLNRDDKNRRADIFNLVISSKIYIFFFITLILLILIKFLELRAHEFYIYLFLYLYVLSAVFLPMWYYQGIQKLKKVTIIQVILKLGSIPIIIMVVDDSGDLIWFVLISSLTVFLTAVYSYINILYTEKIKIKIYNYNCVKSYLVENFPFFLNSLIANIKDHSVVIMMGAFYGMREVALYDLAMKIVVIPRTIFISLNTAILPRILTNGSRGLIVKIIKFEYIIGVITAFIVILIGNYLVEFLGGTNMVDSYYISIILSFTILTWLVVGCYINFILIPNGKSNYIAKNQLFALFSMMSIAAICIIFDLGVYSLPVAVVLSGFIEIFYCKYVVKKENLI